MGRFCLSTEKPHSALSAAMLRQHDNGRAVVEQAVGFAEGGRISGACGFIFLTVCGFPDKTSAD